MHGTGTVSDSLKRQFARVNQLDPELKAISGDNFAAHYFAAMHQLL